MKAILICISCIIFLVGCTQLPVNQSHADLQLAELTDYELKDGFIVIKTVSNGCTFFDSFKVKVADQKRNAMKVVTVKSDECSMKPHLVALQYSYRHLPIDENKEIRLINKTKKHESLF